MIVVGAGPAGSSLAALSAGAGVRTLLVERARFPRDKVCGEFLSAEGCAVLDRLGVRDELMQSGAESITGARIGDTRGRTLDLELPDLGGGEREAMGVSRARLDCTLRDLALRRGAELRERHEAREPIFHDGRIAGLRLREVGAAREETVRARVVVAADGRRSRLAQRLHPRLCDPSRTHPGSWFGLKTHLRAQGGRLSRRVDVHLFDGGYVGLARVEEGRINLCMLTSAAALRAGGSPDALLRDRLTANPAVRESIGDLERCSAWSSCGPLRFGARRAAAAGALFVGDAAGTVDPFCGEGMSNALVGAEVALPHLLEAVERGALTDDLARAYSRAWRRAFLPVTRRVRLMGMLFTRPRLARWVLAGLRASGGTLAPRLIAATRTGIGA